MISSKFCLYILAFWVFFSFFVLVCILVCFVFVCLVFIGGGGGVSVIFFGGMGGVQFPHSCIFSLVLLVILVIDAMC